MPPDPSNAGVVCATQTRTKTHWFNPCSYANPLPASIISPVAGGPSGTDPNALPIPNPKGYLYPQHVTGLSNAIAFTGGLNNQTFGPGYERFNMSLFKQFATLREQHFELRVDIFNLFNHPSWGNPSIQTDASNGGQITAPKNFQANTPDARFFQLSAKYVF